MNDNGTGINKESSVIYDNMVNNFIKKANEKKVKWFPNENKEEYIKNTYLMNSMYQFYKLYKVNELKMKYERENNFQYDYSLRYRPDSIYKAGFIFEDVFKEENAIYGLIDTGFGGHNTSMNRLIISIIECSGLYSFDWNNPILTVGSPEQSILAHIQNLNLKHKHIFNNFALIQGHRMDRKLWNTHGAEIGKKRGCLLTTKINTKNLDNYL